MKSVLAIAFLCGAFSFSFAQKEPIKFGDIPMEDLQMKIYDKDTSAVAVILTDYGDARVAPYQGKLIYERHMRIKILKAEGTSWADVSIPLWTQSGASETISGLKAVTYNLENGKVVQTKMDNGSVFQEKLNKNINVKKFTLPNVKPGSVIEFTYKRNSDFITDFPNWQFQYKIPSRYTEYRAAIPSFWIMERYMNGYLAPQYTVKDVSQTNYTEKANRWVIENVPAFKPEPYMTCEDDYISKINFALAYVNEPGQPSQEIMGSWQKLIENLLTSPAFGKEITGNGSLSKKVAELTAGITEPEKKIQTIFDYVKSSIQWNEDSDFLAYDVKDIFEKKMGSSGDINIALASMLDKTGFVVEPVLLSTRDHGFIRQQVPMTKQLNYVVCSVNLNGKRIFLDATEKFNPLNVLPERCLNGQGILIHPATKTFEWINLEALTKSKTMIHGDFVLAANGELNGKISFTRDGYDAHRIRKQYSNGKDAYVKRLTDGRSWEINKSEFQAMDQVNGSAKEIHEVVIGEHATVAGDIIYINPLLGFQSRENPFKTDSRVYPVDFGSPFEKMILCKIIIPEGYLVDEVPQSKVIALPGGQGKYIYSVNVLGNTINLTSNLTVNKALFTQNEYPFLREFYAQFIAKQNEEIVLKKK